MKSLWQNSGQSEIPSRHEQRIPTGGVILNGAERSEESLSWGSGEERFFAALLRNKIFDLARPLMVACHSGRA